MPFTCAFSSGFDSGFEICAAGPAAPDVPRQVMGAKGPVMRPRFDHILNVRPAGERVREIERIGEGLRSVTRNECEEVGVG